jgi:cell division protein FtsB
MPTTDNKSVLERHVTTILATLITGAVSWLVLSAVNNDKQISGLVIRIESLVDQNTALIAEIKELKDNYVTQAQFADHEARLRLLERPPARDHR